VSNITKIDVPRLIATSDTRASVVLHSGSPRTSEVLFRRFDPLFIGVSRSKWPICLPQPPAARQIRAQSIRVLNAKSVIPDGAVFVPEGAVQKLSLAAESAFKQLNRSGLTGSTKKEESFTCQSTPCVHLPRTPGFQFASSFWEDKKPVHSMLDDAYRQNRMATAAAVRHLNSLHVKAPVFGLVWSDGTVRAHVDWCVSKGQEPPVRATSTIVQVIAYPRLYNRSFVLLCSQARVVTAVVAKGATPTNGTWIAQQT
jgi:hypothetical protein